MFTVKLYQAEMISGEYPRYKVAILGHTHFVLLYVGGQTYIK